MANLAPCFAREWAEAAAASGESVEVHLPHARNSKYCEFRTALRKSRR